MASGCAEGTLLSFAANQEQEGTPLSNYVVDEQGRYSITIYRTGDLSGETTVDLRTIDTVATYGEDYCIDDPRYRTEVLETGGTLTEQYANEEGRAEAEAILNEEAQAVEEAQAESGAEVAQATDGEKSELG